MARGDHIFVRRYSGLYSHHGVDCGDGSVIHYTGDDWRSSRVRRTDTTEFAGDAEIHVHSYEKFYQVTSLEDHLVRAASLRIQRLVDSLRGVPLGELATTPDDVVTRAESRLGDGGFDFVFNNCEHFASWCKTGISNSRQIEAIWRIALNPGTYALQRAARRISAALDGSSRPPWLGDPR